MGELQYFTDISWREILFLEKSNKELNIENVISWFAGWIEGIYFIKALNRFKIIAGDWEAVLSDFYDSRVDITILMNYNYSDVGGYDFI